MSSLDQDAHNRLYSDFSIAYQQQKPYEGSEVWCTQSSPYFFKQEIKD